LPKRCTVACDTPQGIVCCELTLPGTATVAEALAEARRLIGQAAVDWEAGPVGIHGRPCSRQQIPADGDRIELYRALQLDPRAARRARLVRVKKGPGI
jgi:uncharacterized protein